MKNQNNNNSSQNGNRNYEPYVRIIKNGNLISFETVNHDWCIINNKVINGKGVSITPKKPFTNTEGIYVHLSDFDNQFPRLSEIPVTDNWPLDNNSK